MSEKCEMILNWALEHTSFDTTFVRSVMEYIDEHDYPTHAQEKALDNIIESFRIEEEEDDFIVDDDEELSEYSTSSNETVQ